MYLYRNEPIELVPGAWILLHMYLVCAQNKSLISNTALPALCSVRPLPPLQVLISYTDFFSLSFSSFSLSFFLSFFFFFFWGGGGGGGKAPPATPWIRHCHVQLHSGSSTQSGGSVLPSIVEKRDQNSRGCPLLFSNRNLGSFCALGTKILYTHSLWEVVDHSRSKMLETCLIIIHDPGMRPGQESNQGPLD